IGLFTIGLFALTGCVCSAINNSVLDGPAARNGYTEWVYPVAVRAEAEEVLKAQAKEYSDILGDDGVIELTANPVCCFWIEIDGWKPNPGNARYLFQIQDGGAILLATDREQLTLAADRLKAELRWKDGIILLPKGIITN